MQCSVHAVVAVADQAVVTFLDARPPRMKANSWTPSTEPSDHGEPVNGHIVSASRQFRTTARADLAWPTASSRSQARSSGLRSRPCCA